MGCSQFLHLFQGLLNDFREGMKQVRNAECRVESPGEKLKAETRDSAPVRFLTRHELAEVLKFPFGQWTRCLPGEGYRTCDCMGTSSVSTCQMWFGT